MTTTASSMAIIFGHRVRAVRKAAGMTQAAFAQKVGLSGQTAVTRIENGVMESITFEALAAILAFCRNAGMGPSELFLGVSPLLWASDQDILDELARRVGAKALGEMGLRVTDAGGRRPPHAADLSQFGGLGAFVREAVMRQTAEELSDGLAKPLRDTQKDGKPRRPRK